jgi:hypothetical protein
VEEETRLNRKSIKKGILTLKHVCISFRHLLLMNGIRLVLIFQRLLSAFGLKRHTDGASKLAYQFLGKHKGDSDEYLCLLWAYVNISSMQWLLQAGLSLVLQEIGKLVVLIIILYRMESITVMHKNPT